MIGPSMKAYWRDWMKCEVIVSQKVGSVCLCEFKVPNYRVHTLILNCATDDLLMVSRLTRSDSAHF